jgi:uncharacterized membrane protein YhiD involved in acid resistance
MTIDAFLNSLMVSDTNSLGFMDILITMALPFLLNFPITWVYRYTQKHNNYSTTFVHSLFLFSTLSAIITLLIGSNIARAFGLVGALSIIRFRNALKDPIDAVYIFWALGVGMAAGTGFYFAAILLVAFCCLMILFLHFTGYGESKYVDSVLKIITTVSEESKTLPEVAKALKTNTKAAEQMNVIFDSDSDQKTYIYNIRLKKSADSKSLVEAMTALSGVKSAHHLNREAFLFSNV